MHYKPVWYKLPARTPIWKICWRCYCEWSTAQYGFSCPCCGHVC